MEEFDFNLSNDKEYVMKKVKEDGKNLDFASDTLKNDKEVVMEAILQNPVSLEFASNNLKNDKVEQSNIGKQSIIFAKNEIELMGRCKFSLKQL